MKMIIRNDNINFKTAVYLYCFAPTSSPRLNPPAFLLQKPFEFSSGISFNEEVWLRWIVSIGQSKTICLIKIEASDLFLAAF